MSKKPEPESCPVKICENPETGEVELVPTGPCRPGFIEKLRDKAMEKGLTFVIPKVKTREE